MSTWRLGSVTINTSSTSTAILSSGVSTSRDIATLATAGDPTTALRILNRVLHNVRIATHDLTLVTALACVDLTLFFRQTDSCGGVSGTWISLAVSNAMVWPDSISASGRSPATLNIRAIPFSSDGSTAPFTVGSTSGSTTAETDAWQIETTNVTDFSVDFGYRVQTISEPTRYVTTEGAFVTEHMPTMSATINAASEITQAKLDADACATLTVALTKAAACGGTTGADRTYALTGLFGLDDLSAAGRGPGACRVTVFGDNTGLSVT